MLKWCTKKLKEVELANCKKECMETCPLGIRPHQIFEKEGSTKSKPDRHAEVMRVREEMKTRSKVLHPRKTKNKTLRELDNLFKK